MQLSCPVSFEASSFRLSCEQDKSSDIEQQPPFGDRKISNIQPQNRGGGLQNQQEHHIILTKYEAVHPTAVSENNSSSGMLIRTSVVFMYSSALLSSEKMESQHYN